MRRFAYVLDPLCLLCCALYATNRWLIKPHCSIHFFQYWFNDCLLIPCALPPLLLSYRWLKIRPPQAMPTLGEIGWTLLGWSILFEGIGPHIMRTVGDPWDVVAYTGGAIVAAFWWHRPSSPRRNFDALAPYYRFMERILAGSKLQRCRTAFLNRIPAPRKVLIIGQGTGRFLLELRRKFPDARCLCVDSSAEMLRQARATLEDAGLDAAAVQFEHADALKWKPPGAEFDLIVTHFVLDCFTPAQIENIVSRLSLAAVPGAFWLLSDFHQPSAGISRWRAWLILESMYLFFGPATGLAASELTDPDESMARHGFALRERQLYDWGLLHSDWWERPALVPSPS